jgi:hypothetical protein
MFRNRVQRIIRWIEKYFSHKKRSKADKKCEAAHKEWSQKVQNGEINDPPVNSKTNRL